MREFLKELRKHLDIPVDAYINAKGKLEVDVQYSSCGHLEEEVRKATDADKAYFLIEKVLWKKHQDDIKDAELRQLAYLQDKYKKTATS